MADFGLTGARDATTSATHIQTHTTGELGSLVFKHWVGPQVAVEIGVGVMNADETVSPGFVRTNAIIPLLFGASISPPSLALSSSVRPYLSAAVGPYFHSVSELGVSGSEVATTESVPGARFGLGANWFVARHFILDIQGDYHAVGAFDHPDAVTLEAESASRLRSARVQLGRALLASTRDRAVTASRTNLSSPLAPARRV